MVGKGNGTPERCALNLLMITRGEVPFDRLKGKGAGFIDAPASIVGGDAINDAVWLINTYEPRMVIDTVDMAGTLAEIGDFGIKAEVKRREA